MTDAASRTSKAESNQGTNKIVAIWRTVQKLDANEWRKSRDDAPLRFIRWLAALLVVAGTWYLQGTPHNAAAWLPALVLVALLLLPDASSIAVAGFSLQARQAANEATQAAQETHAASESVKQLTLILSVAGAAGEAAGESAQARSASKESADEALEGYL